MKDEESNATGNRPDGERELSDYRHQADQLALENKMLRAVLDSMPDNISIKDLKGRYIFDNASHCHFLGAKNTADVVGKTVFDFLPVEFASTFHAEDLRVLHWARQSFGLWTRQSTSPATSSGCRFQKLLCAVRRAK